MLGRLTSDENGYWHLIHLELGREPFTTHPVYTCEDGRCGEMRREDQLGGNLIRRIERIIRQHDPSMLASLDHVMIPEWSISKCSLDKKRQHGTLVTIFYHHTLHSSLLLAACHITSIDIGEVFLAMLVLPHGRSQD